MFKTILLFLVPLILFIGSSPAKANVIEWQQAKQKIEIQRNELKSKIKNVASLPEKQKEKAANENIRINMQDNKLAAYQQAYETAINLMQPGQILPTAAQPFPSFSPIILQVGETVPKEYVPYYKAAGERYGVNWFVLAAIHETETNFSRSPTMISSVGAIGHMQFMPSTFAAYRVDGNGDGITSPWNLQDSIFTAAHYLASRGYSKNVREAIWNYNHADWYVNKVLETATKIRGSYHES